ncbi:MAG: ribonucleoside-diphosphate reductase subunit alpha [Pseudomonadales bacterium]|nr:ribonucleoside-diphosphate reductase subunit alpha [Pseudomonadales bacterium]
MQTKIQLDAVESPTPDQTAAITATAPGQLKVIKRDGTVVPYDDSKISVAIMKAFLAIDGDTAADSSRIRQLVRELTAQISNTYERRMPSGGTLHIEELQDQVELELMRSGEQRIARAYVLYREERARIRKTQDQAFSLSLDTPIQVKQADGSLATLDTDRMLTLVSEACDDLSDVDSKLLIDRAMPNMYDGISVGDVSASLLITARTLVEEEPNYTYVTARLLLDEIRSKALSFLKISANNTEDYSATQGQMHLVYPKALSAFIKKGIELELLSPLLQKFDIERLGAALKPERDLQFNYLGIQTLYDRYFLHSEEIRIELPQVFFMRVAMGLSIEEQDKNDRAIEFYNLLSSFDYMSSTPTLFNAGTLRPQLSSCFLTTVSDHLQGIYGAIKDNAMLSKWAGGLGNDWTSVRALGARIKGTNGKSQGVVPFLKVVNDTAVAVNQGGKRKGAVCAYLETWHLDIEEFLELRKNTGDDRRRTHDMNTANWIPDLFMKRVLEEGQWTLFSPDDTPDLHDLYGQAFEARFCHYEKLADAGEIKLFKRVNAQDIWRKILSMLFETGHPWITFKDACNIRSPQQHVGVIHSSNLCTEITLNTSESEIAVCNLGSVNLAQHVDENGLDLEKLQRTINTAIRMLDNVIDINYYSVPQARNSNLRHRPIGLGIMGFQDALYKQGIAYASEAALKFADVSMEAVSYFAISASSELAKERGSYSTFEGSLWSRGILPLDSLKELSRERGEGYLDANYDSTLAWGDLRKKVKINGMRNSNVMAIAPTATIANITGVCQSIEPTYQNLYVKSNLSGEFTVVNAHMVRDLKAQGLWDKVMINDLKFYDGSLAAIDRVPPELKHRYSTAFEVEPRWLVGAASRRQKWIDQAQSLNLYIAEASGKKLDITYKMAWLSGLKTTYYLRALSATATEKSTVERGTLNAVTSQQLPDIATQKNETETTNFELDMGEAAAVPLACSIDSPDCEACQ